MSLFALFRAVAMSHCPVFRKKVVTYLNSKLRPKRNLPFVVYFSEESTRDKLVFRVEHRNAHTSNRVFVTIKEVDNKRWSRRQLNIDASDGSNWHHLKFEFVTWFRIALESVPSDSFLEKVTA
jgi:hypothetical protein